MVKFKLNIADSKEGKTHTHEVDEPESLALVGKKIGDTVEGSLLGVPYKSLKITGGSDQSGFPLRPDIHGGVKKKVLITKGIGLRRVKSKGYRRRKLVRGNTITRDIYQVNLVIAER